MAADSDDGRSSAPAGSPPDVARAEVRILSARFVLGWLINFAQYLSFYVLVTTLAVYAITRFAASDAEAGLASSSFIVGATIVRIFAGPVVDAFGPRRVLLVVLAVGVAAAAAYLPTDSLASLIAVRLLHGATFAIASTASMTLAQTALPEARRAEGTGYLILGPTLATAVAPTIGIALVGAFDYDMLFWVTLLIAVIGFVIGLFVHDGSSRRTSETHPRFRFSWRGILAPAVFPIGVFMLIVGLAFAGIVTYLNGLGIERDLPLGLALFFPVYGLTMLCGRFVFGRLQDQRGDGVVIAIGLAGMILAPLVLAVATEDAHLVVAAVLCGIGYGTLMPAAQTIAVRSVPPHRIGSGLSSLFLFTDIGFGVGPVLLGFLLSWLGFSWLFVVLAGFVALAGCGYAIANRRR